MRKILYLFMALLVFAGCKKSSFESVFDDSPEGRMQKSLAEVNSILTSAPNGWIATLPTLAGGGYGFYMAFDVNQNVTMYGDLNDNASTKLGTSTYRVKADLGAVLIFDTYNYISLLQDPNPGSFGGVQGSGHKSDQEFVYDHSTADSVIFIGKKYRQPLSMVKATAAQKATYVAGGYKTAIDKFKNFFTTTANPYIEIVVGSTTIKTGVTFDFSTSVANGKRNDLTGTLADGKISTTKTKYAFTLDGVTLLNGGLIFQGITFVKYAWKDVATLAAYDSTGKEYLIKSSVLPLFPLYQLWGTKYNGMLSEFKTIYPGTSALGADILNFYHNNMTNAYTGYAFNYARINTSWNVINKRFTIDGFSSQNGGSSGWVTSSTYSYTVDANGVYKFSLYSPPAGGYVSKALDKLYTFILNNRITFDYYIDGTNVYAKMTSVDNPAIVMTFVLQ